MQKRDVAIIRMLVKNMEPQTREKAGIFISNLDEAAMKKLFEDKEFLSEHKVAIKALGEQAEFADSCTSGYCTDIVCNFMACVSSSGCPGGACSQNGCSAAAGCYVGSTSGCSGAPTCGDAACSSNAGGGCGNASCSYASGNDVDESRKKLAAKK